MVCKRCGTRLASSDSVCPNCGTQVGMSGSKKKKTEYVIVKKSPAVIITAVILLVVAVVGIWYSTTDQARILGRWKCERVISAPDAEVEKTEHIQLEFDIFGNVTETDQTTGAVMRGRYSLSRNKLTTKRTNPQKIVVEDFQFMGNSMVVANENDKHPLTNIDAIRFYWLIVAFSIVIGIVGLTLLVKQKKKPVKKSKGAGSTFLSGLFSRGGSLNGGQSSEQKSPFDVTGDDMSHQTTENAQTYSTTDTTIGGTRLKTTMRKSEEINSSERIPDSTGSGLISTFGTGRETSDSSSTISRGASTSVPPSDSDFLHHAGDL